MTARLVLSPQGKVYLRAFQDADEVAVTGQSDRLGSLRAAFEKSTADGLLELAKTQTLEHLLPEFVFWRQWSVRLFQSLCHLDPQQRIEFVKPSSHEANETGKRTEEDRLLSAPDDLQLAVIIAEAPPMPGLENLNPTVLKSLWLELVEVARQAAKQAGGLVELLKQIDPRWQLLGRVTFHLAENRKDTEKPFAFLATYSHQLSGKSSVKHLPLADALRQYVSKQDQAKLAELLTPVRQAAEQSSLIKSWLETRALFQAQGLGINQAYEFLRAVPMLEQCGLAVRVPDWWRVRHASRPAVQIQLGNRAPSQIGAEALLDFSVGMAMDGETLTEAEQRELLAADDGLMLLRGKWVEVDKSRLQEALDHWKQLKQEHLDGVDFLRGMRMLTGASLNREEDELAASDWAQITAGTWLQELLSTVRDPSGEVDCHPGEGLRATLRPYQVQGVRWLWFMTQLRLGACLADDMGLGKTIQLIDLILQRRSQAGGQISGKPKRQDQGQKTLKQLPPSLLVVPASLLGNWKVEFEKFAPQLRVLLMHRSEMDAGTMQQLEKQPQQVLKGVDAVVTSYTLVRSAEWINEMDWDLVVLDEAQAIKNGSSALTRAVKKLKASCRVVLTGTPVENQLGDLWSLFDFCSPGLLGTSKQFKDYLKKIGKDSDVHGYASLRRLVQPYILRRMKTDPKIAPDLPEKTEMRVECGLSKRQAALYQKLVKELATELKSLAQTKQEAGVRRRGIVLSTMMQLKQICNHPSQLTGADQFLPDDSGKFLQLAEICTSIGARQDKALVFTQFQSMCQPLADYLATLFGRNGLVLHGATPVKRRKELVQTFQQDESVPFFVISLKAGGTGLNLTAASHVIHFDRWWNPAVENQATDRAFRIGQKQNVLVHKFVCRGTLEGRIDEMLRSKQELTNAILSPSSEGERMLTEMGDQELLEFVSLDVKSCNVS
jgi:superfamily II DNA or RNA helicase